MRYFEDELVSPEEADEKFHLPAGTMRNWLATQAIEKHTVAGCLVRYYLIDIVIFLARERIQMMREEADR